MVPKIEAKTIALDWLNSPPKNQSVVFCSCQWWLKGVSGRLKSVNLPVQLLYHFVTNTLASGTDIWITVRRRRWR